jgi:hypothetical protein
MGRHLMTVHKHSVVPVRCQLFQGAEKRTILTMLCKNCPTVERIEEIVACYREQEGRKKVGSFLY